MGQRHRRDPGQASNYPLIGDDDFSVSKLYGMLAPDAAGDAVLRTAADNQTVRNVFAIGPDGKVKLILVCPMSKGSRRIDSLRLTAKHKGATSANWRRGGGVIIAGSVSDEKATELFGESRAPKPYVRIAPKPREVAAPALTAVELERPVGGPR
jgi:alkyl hydroperoxide reductase subunit AhpC